MIRALAVRTEKAQLIMCARAGDRDGTDIARRTLASSTDDTRLDGAALACVRALTTVSDDAPAARPSAASDLATPR